jgi:hypothetical protein
MSNWHLSQVHLIDDIDIEIDVRLCIPTYAYVGDPTIRELIESTCRTCALLADPGSPMAADGRFLEKYYLRR